MLQLTPLTSTSHPEERDTRISETRWFLELFHDSAFGLDLIQSEFPHILTPQNHVYLDQLHQEHLLLLLIKKNKKNLVWNVQLYFEGWEKHLSVFRDLKETRGLNS